MKEKFFGFNLDFLGFLAALLCAIHCALLPLVLTLSFLSGLAFLKNPVIEWAFIGISLVVASWSLMGSYKKVHQQKQALMVVLLGFFLIFISRFMAGNVEHLFTVSGGITIAIAHVMNWQLLRQYKLSVAGI